MTLTNDHNIILTDKKQDKHYNPNFVKTKQRCTMYTHFSVYMHKNTLIQMQKLALNLLYIKEYYRDDMVKGGLLFSIYFY